MACGGLVFEAYREIECDGEDEGGCYCGFLKMEPHDNLYIKMDKKDSEGKYQLSMTRRPDPERPPPDEYLFKILYVELEDSEKDRERYTFTNKKNHAKLVANTVDLVVYGMPQDTPLTGTCRNKWLITEGKSPGTKRLCVIDDSKTQYYVCIDNGKGFHLKKLCDQTESEIDGDVRIVDQESLISKNP